MIPYPDSVARPQAPAAPRVPRPRPWALALALLAGSALLLAGCARISHPRGWASPVVGEKVIIVSTGAGELSAISRDDFARRWRFPGPDDDNIKPLGIYGTPLVTEDAVYFGGYDGSIYALDAKHGRPLWEPFETAGPVIGGVVLDEAIDTLFAVSDDGEVYGLDPAKGRLKSGWPFKTGDSIWATPLLAGGTLYVSSLDGKLYALDPASGEEQWRFSAGAGLISSPLLEDGTIVVSGIDRRLYAVDAATGDERWHFKADNWFLAQPLVSGGVVYAPSLDGSVYALELGSGEPAWPQPYQAENPIRARPVLAPGSEVLVVVDKDGLVYGLDPASGSLKWPVPLRLEKAVLSDPVVSEGKVLVSAQGGHLFQIDAEARSFREITVRTR